MESGNRVLSAGREKNQGGNFLSGGGFVVACLLGFLGIVAGATTWLHTGSLLVAFAVYILFPGVSVVAFLIMSSKPNINTAARDNLPRAIPINERRSK